MGHECRALLGYHSTFMRNEAAETAAAYSCPNRLVLQCKMARMSMTGHICSTHTLRVWESTMVVRKRADSAPITKGISGRIRPHPVGTRSPTEI